MFKFWIFLTFLVTSITATEYEWSREYDTPYFRSEGDDDSARTTKTVDAHAPEGFNDSHTFGENENNDLSEQINDYQVEDNRSIGKDENIEETDTQSSQDADDSFNLLDYPDDPDKKTLSQEIDEEINNNGDEMIDLSMNEEVIKKIINDTKYILSEDTGNDFEEDSYIKDEVSKNITLNYKAIIDETKKLLDETKETFEETVDQNSENYDVDNSKEENNDDVDRKEVKSDDLVADLKELNDIKNKLSDNENSKFIVDDTDAFRNDYDENTDYEEIGDEDLDQIFDNNDVSTKNTDEAVKHKVEPLPDDSISILRNIKPIQYQDDDLLADDTVLLETKDSLIKTPQFVFTETESLPEIFSQDNPNDNENILDTKNLTDAQVDLLLKDFSDKNLKRIQSEVKSRSTVQRIWLSVDKPTIITSPGYPSPYQTNSITDWIIEGIGSGIEFNVTDCAINGHNGDYLLVKPGRADDSGQDGLIFTYTLNTERNYRFFDVDRMFMRFEAEIGMQFMRGFSVSAKMLISPPFINEPEPEPEPEVRYVDEAITLNLGGISLDGFLKVEEQFRKIVADMATVYINANDISTNVNNTLDVTQILSRAVCFHNWPKYEMCAEVKFGVPVSYEEGERPRLHEDDLLEMWFEFSKMDPFATRLRMLGITEFQVPNDRGVLLVWLVIAGGVVISMIMLSFALWRFSCFEDYTRMPSYSDTDSVSEKRKLDMFPTPHQTLPPLFSEDDYKWADQDDKVNLGGYSNKNFLQDDMFDIDSDDDVVPGRNRDNSIQPRDIYSV